MPRDSASSIQSARLLVGRYRLEQEIGRGGMGVVFRSVDTMMERPVAVKLLHSSNNLEHPATQRFLHEAKNAARIQHEHVIQVFDVGKSDAGEPFFVMELVEGVSLSALLQKEGRIPPARAVHIGRQICEALHAAHRAAIVHRDLKLGNVLLIEREGQGDFVKLIDFGISRAADRSRALTHAGETIGTIGYMAPEQLLKEPVDARTDIYAFGVLLYRLLTGKGLFKSNTPSSLARDHLTSTPIAPHLRAPDAGIPEALSAVVLRCLEKRPRDRYPNARELAWALRRALDPDGSPDSAPPSSRALPPPLDPASFDATVTPVGPVDTQEGGPMSVRAPGPTLTQRKIDRPLAQASLPEPADSTAATIEGFAGSFTGGLASAPTTEEAEHDELPPSESGARRTPEVLLTLRQRAALEDPPASRRPPPPSVAPPARAVRVPLPEPREPPPSSRGSRFAQPPPEPRAGAASLLRARRPMRSAPSEPPPSRTAPPPVHRASVPAPAAAPKQVEPDTEHPSGTRLSPPGGRSSGPTFELADVPPTIRPPPAAAQERRCASCDSVCERYARRCKSCGALLDPASQEEIRQGLGVRASAPPPSMSSMKGRESSPLGGAFALFRWAPPLAWILLSVGGILALVLGELLLKTPSASYAIVLGVLIAVGVTGMIATR